MISKLDNSPIEVCITADKRRGGTLVNVLVFLSVACVVGFVAWLLLQHHLFKIPSIHDEVAAEQVVELTSENEVEDEKPVGPTAEEKLQIQQELDRRKAEEERILAEKRKEEERLARELRVSTNLDAAKKAIGAKQWDVAGAHVGLLLDDSYSLEEVAKFNALIEKGKVQERADLLEIKKLFEAAQKLDNGKYSPAAVDLLDKALLIYPNHSSTMALRKKINGYPYSLRVPEDVATLNDAADLLRVGDTAILGRGVFKFPAMLEKGIKIKGQGEKLTSIECDTTVTSAFTLTGADQSYVISDLTVMGTNFEDDAAERFPLITLVANLTMRNVVVKNGSGHGVAVVSGRLSMEKCNVSQNVWDGVSIMGVKSFAEIKDCDISGNYDHGVDFWNGASGKLMNVTANDNSGSGILIMGAGANVHLVQVKTERNSQCGIVVNSQAEAKLERVFSSSNLLSGVVVQGKGTKLTCGISVANKNGEAGFFIDPAATIENFISATAEENGNGDVVRKAIVLPKVPVPAEVVPVPDVKDQGT